MPALRFDDDKDKYADNDGVEDDVNHSKEDTTAHVCTT